MPKKGIFVARSDYPVRAILLVFPLFLLLYAPSLRWARLGFSVPVARVPSASRFRSGLPGLDLGFSRSR